MEEAEHGELVPEIRIPNAVKKAAKSAMKPTTAPEDCECPSDEEDTEECEESGITTIWRTVCWRN